MDTFGQNAARKAQRDYDRYGIAADWEDSMERDIAGTEALPPKVAPALDLLASELLMVADRGVSAHVPPALAARWLRAAWAAYGYPADTAPGLRADLSMQPYCRTEPHRQEGR